MLESVVQAYQQGNEGAFETLLQGLKNDVSYLRREFVPGYTTEDIEQELLLVLHTVAQKFDSSKGVSFRTFYSNCCRNRVNSLRSQQDRGGYKILKDSALGHFLPDGTDDSRRKETVKEAIDTERIAFIDTDLDNAEVMAQIDNLPITEKEKQVLHLYTEGYNLQEISYQMGEWVTVKGCWAARVLAKIRKKIAPTLVGN